MNFTLINIYIFLLFFISFSLIGLSFIQKERHVFIRFISFLIFLFIFLLSNFLWTFFDPLDFILTTNTFYCWNVYLFNTFLLTFVINLDIFSLLLIFLTTFIFVICSLQAWEIKNIKNYMLLFLIIELLLLLVFSVMDLFFFYIFFEIILIPIFFIILLWGTRSRKLKAAYYLFFYTIFGSLFFLICLFLLFYNFKTTNLFLLLLIEIPFSLQLIIWLCLFISFAIKIPIMPFHIWLLEAHVEAPTGGSIILASLLLKMGTYGLIRFLIPLTLDATIYFKPVVYILAIISIFYASLAAIRQVDIKKIIAYSSIAHMNFCVIGIFSLTYFGLIGSFFLMLGHGLISTALFFLVGVLYDRYHTRLLKYYGGLVTKMPLFAFFFFFFNLANMSFPGTVNFIGEFLILLSILNKNFFIVLVMLVSLFLTSVYSMKLCNLILFGELKLFYIQKYTDINRREFIILFLLFFLTMLFGICPNICLNLLYSYALYNFKFYYFI
jgi:proton-translocating NADH-quinone oxidoreductase chain M